MRAKVVYNMLEVEVDGPSSEPAGTAAGPAPPNEDENLKQYHRIGGAAPANLRLKPAELTLDPPGISLLRAESPEAAAQQLLDAFPNRKAMKNEVAVVSSASRSSLRAAGFELVFTPSRKLASHYRLTHPAGAAGFNEANLERLARAFSHAGGQEQ